jgi:hypothetical protein
MIAAGGKEDSLVAVSLPHLETEDIAVEAERAFEIGDFEMDVSDSGLRVKW